MIYGLYAPDPDESSGRSGVEDCLKAFLDIMFWERGHQPLKNAEKDAGRIQAQYYSYILPDCNVDQLVSLMNERKYVVLQSPPGTGKTRMALELLNNYYDRSGMTVQFHPNTTYENFVGGLAPLATEGELGFVFPQARIFNDGRQEYKGTRNKPFLLLIDEIKRRSQGFGRSHISSEQTDSKEDLGPAI